MSTVLAIESSCDETGVAIVKTHSDGSLQLLANQLASSVEEHTRYGGVVPEVASRAHLEALPTLMRAALCEAHLSRPDAIAVTVGPGLAGALLVGVAAAKAYATAWDVPLYGVNHLGGHLAADLYVHGALPPCIGLLVSGGHTHLIRITSLADPFIELGSTCDDAAGEAYDKVARLLGLGYPGGKVLDQLACQGNPQTIVFPRPMTRPGDPPYGFSFSGLKTAVLRYLDQHPHARREDIAAGFQEAVADVLTAKALHALQHENLTTLLIAGGVGANSRVRALAQQRCTQNGITLRIPPAKFCTDNAAMIAAFASQLILAGKSPSPSHLSAYPNLPLDCSLIT